MPTRAAHRLCGHINPKCTVCGRTPMQIQANPFARCERATLPFDERPAAIDGTVPEHQKGH